MPSRSSPLNHNDQPGFASQFVSYRCVAAASSARLITNALPPQLFHAAIGFGVLALAPQLWSITVGLAVSHGKLVRLGADLGAT
jgi:hypothetical protein